MRVKLIAVTELVGSIPEYEDHPFSYSGPLTDCDDLAEQAGRLCYLSWSRPNPKTATNEGYIANIINQEHYSVLEHASATVYIDGITRNCTHELIRHRHHSFSEVSQRYVDAGSFEFVEHPGLAEVSPIGRGRLDSAVKEGLRAYDEIVEDLTELGRGRKQARQAARHALASGMGTRILMTGNMRAWREMLRKRLSPAADLEIQQVAQLILRELKHVAPNTFQDFTDLAEPSVEVEPTK